MHLLSFYQVYGCRKSLMNFTKSRMKGRGKIPQIIFWRFFFQVFTIQDGIVVLKLFVGCQRSIS